MQDTIRQKPCQKFECKTLQDKNHTKNLKRDSVSAYVHMMRNTPLYAAVRILDESPIPHQLRTYLIDSPFLNQKHIKTFEYRIHWNINIRKNKFLYEKINGSVGWNKHSGEQH